MMPQFGVYRAETYNFKMSEPDEFDEDDTFRYWRHQLEGRDPLGTMIIQGHLLVEEELNAFIEKAFKNPKAINRLRFFWKVQVMKAFTHTSSARSTPCDVG